MKVIIMFLGFVSFSFANTTCELPFGIDGETSVCCSEGCGSVTGYGCASGNDNSLGACGDQTVELPGGNEDSEAEESHRR